MPRGDGTGPVGFGPMTGRKAGYCVGFSTPGSTKLGRRRFSRRVFRGRGRGWRHCFHETGLPYWARKDYPLYENDFNEEKILKEEVDYLTEQLDKVKERLNEIKEQKKEGQNND